MASTYSLIKEALDNLSVTIGYDMVVSEGYAKYDSFDKKLMYIGINCSEDEIIDEDLTKTLDNFEDDMNKKYGVIILFRVA